MCRAGKQKQQSAAAAATADADADDENGVMVHEEDFYSALSRLVPSLSAAELKRYDRLQEMFTQRRHSNQHQQQQRPVTVSTVAGSGWL